MINHTQMKEQEIRKDERRKCMEDVCMFCGGRAIGYKRVPDGPNEAGNYTHQYTATMRTEDRVLCVASSIMVRERFSEMVSGQAELDEMPESEKLKHCSGCHDDFYNHPGNSTNGRCWMLPKMTLVQRKEVSIDQRPPWNQKPRLFPHCYHKQRYVYVKPDQTC